MNTVRAYVVVWLCGLVVGLVLVERWRRMGQPSANVGNVIATDTVSTAVQGPAAMPKVSNVVVSGAKADYERARHLLKRVVPWPSSSAPRLADMEVLAATRTSAGSSESNDGSPQK